MILYYKIIFNRGGARKNTNSINNKIMHNFDSNFFWKKYFNNSLEDYLKEKNDPINIKINTNLNLLELILINTKPSNSTFMGWWFICNAGLNGSLGMGTSYNAWNFYEGFTDNIQSPAPDFFKKIFCYDLTFKFCYYNDTLLFEHVRPLLDNVFQYLFDCPYIISTILFANDDSINKVMYFNFSIFSLSNLLDKLKILSITTKGTVVASDTKKIFFKLYKFFFLNNLFTSYINKSFFLSTTTYFRCKEKF